MDEPAKDFRPSPEDQQWLFDTSDLIDRGRNLCGHLMMGAVLSEEKDQALALIDQIKEALERITRIVKDIKPRAPH